jgi:TolA-binding protein
MGREGRLAIGESFYREGKYDDAAAEFEKLIATAPDSELGQRAFYNRGWCYAQKGQTDKTLADFNDFLKKFPESALAPDAQFWVADHYMKQKDYIKAQEQFQLLVKNYADQQAGRHRTVHGRPRRLPAPGLHHGD